MNTIYARDISKKTRAGKKAKQRRGEFCGSFAPYGYIKTGTSFVLDDEAAPIAKQIFLWALEGLSDAAVARKLNEMRIAPPGRYRFEKGITTVHKECKLWHKSAIKRITENPAYTGAMVSGKSESVRGGSVRMNDHGDWLVFENAHPAIVDRDIFNAAQEIRNARKLKHRTAEGERNP